MCKFNYDLTAAAIRMKISADLTATQAKVVKECGLNRNWFNAFLRRRLNLLDEDIETILKYLKIDANLERIRGECDKGKRLTIIA